jgi:hypothetical protein
MDTVAILLDGGFVKKVLAKKLGHFPAATDITGLVAQLMRLGPPQVSRILGRQAHHSLDSQA